MTLAMLIAGTAAAAGTTDHFLADRHVERGVKCESCHVNGDTSKPVRKAQCLACHKGHQQSTLSCSQCHKFNLKTP